MASGADGLAGLSPPSELRLKTVLLAGLFRPPAFGCLPSRFGHHRILARIEAGEHYLRPTRN